jgi:hypothetical protein
MAKKLDYVVTIDKDVRTIWIKNATQKQALFRSNDAQLIANRIEEIENDIKKSKNRAETLVALYRFAKENGCVVVMQSPPTGGIISMKPVGDKWHLILRRGNRHIIVRKGDRESIKEAYMNLLKIKQVDPRVLDTMWDYAMQKAKVATQAN